MVSQYHALAPGSQGGGQPFALGLGEDDAPKLVIDSLGVAIEIAHVLVDHVQPPGKSAPCLASPAVAVTGGMHIRPRLVHGAMYEKPRCISRPGCVPAHYLTIVVDEHHVAGVQQAKVAAERVGPEGVRMFRVAHTDVATHALGQVVACKHAEGACHV